VRDTAAELLNLYAVRASRKGHAFEFSAHDYQAFAEGFGFEETPDQQAAIEAVRRDMSAGFPMDRLVCGDVGFGKTEVALRAAFVAVPRQAGRRSVPDHPARRAAHADLPRPLRRLAGAHRGTVALPLGQGSQRGDRRINSGAIDIVIGTHKLLTPELRFGRLGLVIIDEEHRFGVRQKERLKALRAEVDVLTLTATPIPRTMALSLEGIRDFSSSPPRRSGGWRSRPSSGRRAPA